MKTLTGECLSTIHAYHSSKHDNSMTKLTFLMTNPFQTDYLSRLSKSLIEIDKTCQK